MAKRHKKPVKVTSVRKDARGNYRDQKGRPVSAERAKRFKTFYDSAGRKRLTKGGRFAPGTTKAPARREAIRRAFRPAQPIERARRVEKLPRKLARGAAGKVRIRQAAKGRKRGGRATQLEKLFGARFRTVSDFAELVERDGRLLGRSSFTVVDPVGGTEEHTVERAVRRATARATKNARGLVAMTVVTSVSGEEVGRETVFVRVENDLELNSGAMSAIFRGLREGGYEASAGHKTRAVSHLEEAEEIEVEILVYGLD